MLRKIGVWAGVALALLAAGWFGAPAALDWWVARRLEAQIAAHKAELAAEQEQKNAALQDLQAAKTEAVAARVRADAYKRQADQDRAERQVLVKKLKDTAASLAAIREDALRVPQSQLLARIRHALDRLHAPVASLGGGPAAGGGGTARSLGSP